MDKNDMLTIPYVVFESNQSRHERTTRRLIIVIIITILLLFVSNGLWLYAWMQYDYSGTNYSQDGSGYNNINTGNQGDVNNGADFDDSDTPSEE